MIDATWLDVLACPWCVTRPSGTTLAKGELELQGPKENPTALRCKQCGRVYAIREGIPDLIVEKATQS